MELDKNGLNTALNATVLPEVEMRKLGFTDHSAVAWYYCSRVGAGITFNVSIPKDGSRFRLDVLDEDFGQPYDYQEYLVRNPKQEFALGVKAEVESQMNFLSIAGVISGFTRDMYI
jgi:hypothetical protein